MGKGKKRAVKEKYSRKENMMGFLFILPAMISGPDGLVLQTGI